MITRGRSFSGYERNCCFLNLGSETKGSSINFADISAASVLNLIDDTRAIIATDWDHDGDLDLWVTNREGPRVRLLRNNLEQDQRSGSVSLHLKGTTCNLDAIGAKLTLIMGPKRMTRALRAGDGFLSQSSKRILFGMKKNISEIACWFWLKTANMPLRLHKYWQTSTEDISSISLTLRNG